MLDERMKMMLEAANTLTADDLEFIRADGTTVGTVTKRPPRPRPKPAPPIPLMAEKPPEPATRLIESNAPAIAPASPSAPSSRGEYERQRSRESKVSTACLGEERVKHPWWPLGTTVVGQIGAETFTAEVVENFQVKSGRSLKITSGPAKGTICITPTRAAMVATESYRQAQYMGRGGGVTNGWSFWQPVNK